MNTKHLPRLGQIPVTFSIENYYRQVKVRSKDGLRSPTTRPTLRGVVKITLNGQGFCLFVTLYTPDKPVAEKIITF